MTMNAPPQSNGANGYGRTNGANGYANGTNGHTNGASHPNGHTASPPAQNGHPGANPEPLEPIAIVGMAMRLPGGVHDADAYWDLLVNKRSGQCTVPKDRYNVEAWYGPGKIGHVTSKQGYFLEELDLGNIDLSFWTMTKQEVEVMDPQQRLMLEVVYECLQNAGQKNWKGRNIGCYLGTFEGDWLELDGRDPQNGRIHRLTGYGDYMVANRVSYEFGFVGPSVTIRTACSASLTGLHDACHALYTGECESAVVGATNLIFSPRTTITMQEQGVMSPTGSCKSFDANADGYCRGEAVSALFVKKLSDAIRDGDPVRAVIRSTCINAGGRSASLTTPNAASHEYLIRRGHGLAGLTDFSKTAMIECHGTGTRVGDPVEVSAVANVFGDYGIYIGSVKTNLGHSEGASGLSSVIKMVLALEHKTIPPNINFKTPNPLIPFEKAKLKVPVEPMPWPAGRAERVGVNSFGIGGSNAHVLLESASTFGVGKASQPSTPELELDAQQQRLLVFSAKHPEALRRMAEDHESYLSSHPEALQDLSYSLGMKRELLSYRAFCVTSGEDSFEMSKTNKPGNKAAPKLVFAFTGQGAQWAQMGKQLIEREPSFRRSIRALDGYLMLLPDPPKWTLEDEILKPAKSSRLTEPDFSQSCCTAIQIALVNLLHEWNITPDAVVGHSSGEIAAAYACGSITAQQAIMIAFDRGVVSRGAGEANRGGMAAVGLGRDDVTGYLIPGSVLIGCENSPSSVTLTGDKDALDGVLENIRRDHPDVFVRALRVNTAYHSHHMKAVESQYQSLLGNSITAKDPVVPFFSSVTGEMVKSGKILGASYWPWNLVSPVLFSTAVGSILEHMQAPSVFIEIGPHSALAGPIRQILRSKDSSDEYVATLTRARDGQADLLKTAGELWIKNVDVDLLAVNGRGTFLTDLPPYPWHYDTPHWFESRLSREWRLREFPHHDILGSRIIESTEFDPSWRNVLNLDSVSWIQEHEVAGDILFPGVGYICMAGEAIRQLTGSTDFSVRRVHFNQAFVLQQGEPVEVITHLRPVRLTNSLDSAWHDFSVSSLNGSSWIKHSFGQVRAGSDFAMPDVTVEPLKRNIPANIWYRTMRKFGLDYGPRFFGMSEMSADPLEKIAVATLKNDIREGETFYSIHPVTLDCIIQLFSTAAYHGLPRLFEHLVIPSYIEELYVKPPAGEIRIKALSDDIAKGAMSGDLYGVSEGETVIKLTGLRFSRIGEADDVSGADPHAAVELEWKSDINLLEVSHLIHTLKDRTECHLLMDRLALACMIETCHRLGGVDAAKHHLGKYRKWLNTQLQEAGKGHYPNVPDCANLVKMNSHERTALINDLFKQSLATMDEDGAATATAIHRIFTSCEGILTGATDPLDLLLGDEVLHKLYNFMQNSEYSQFLELVSHYKPNLKVLEIGAGTGGTTSTALPHLKSAYGERMYLSYTYTDISAGFFVAAKERFKNYPGIEYAVLDISQDPVEQGFEPESFDLVIACNVLHATPSLTDTLHNVRKLLHPRGRLFLQELSPATKWINYVMGVLSGWWLGDNDGRADEPYVSKERWDAELKKADFEGIDAVSYDGYLNNNIVAMPTPPKKDTKRITILCSDAKANNITEVTSTLRKSGYDLDFCTIYQTPPPGQDIVSLLDVEMPFLRSATPEQLEAFARFPSRIQDSGVLWVTGAAQIKCKNPDYALILGVARNIRVELELDFATLELETFNEDGFNAVPRVLQEFQRRVREPTIDPQLEWAYADGKVQVSKYHWISISKELADEKHAQRPRKLEMHKPGFANTLYWKQVDPMELKADEVELDVKAVGLNFKDVLISIGVVEGHHTVGNGLGYETCGIVRKVGAEVKDLKVGDRVFCITSGCFTTSLTAKETLCVKVAEGLNSIEAASMPSIYYTAIHCLQDVARMQKGDSVLIHSACGGVGLAAIQISQMVGVEIFCTVGSTEKVEYLMNNFGIPRNHIFHSRDATFLPDVMRETNGRGVDIVLNSLSGELLHASWKCVAEFGTMVEIGRRDFVGQGMLAMDMFESNRSFVGLDLLQISTDRPSRINNVLRRAMGYYEKGFIKPISPLTEFPATHIEEAFRHLQQGQHIGKAVISMPEDPEALESTAGRKQLVLRPDRAYLSVGGLGGLGRSVATWLVEKGARHLVFFSRSAGSLPRDDPYILELEAQGVTVQTISGNVCNISDVQHAIGLIGKPIGGVLQATMVLKDTALVDMKYEHWQTAVQPKVEGTWNLHEALQTQAEPLDFFFLFSSISGITGQWGQANYASGNAFLDAFVQYRHSLGLPASTIDIGVVEDVGYLSQNSAILESLKATSAHTLHEQDLLDSLQLMFHRSYPHSSTPISNGYVNRSHIAIGMRSTLPLSAPNNRVTWKKDPRMAVYRNLEDHDSSTGTATSEDLAHFLRDVSSNPASLEIPESKEFLATEIGTTLFSFMMRNDESIDLSASLTALGVDSLVSIELRNWFKQKVGVEFTVLEIVGASSITQLGELAGGKLLEKIKAKM